MFRKLIFLLVTTGLAAKALQRFAHGAQVESKLDRTALARWEDEGGTPSVDRTVR
jgi:hypothetical protein